MATPWRPTPLAAALFAGVWLLSSADYAFDPQGAADLDMDIAPPPDLRWTEASELTLVQGEYFGNRSSPYVRLPAEAKAKVRSAIWDLAQNSAGLAVAFETDAITISVNYSLTSQTIGMWHMPPTGVSGAELWAQDPRNGDWRWVGTTQPLQFPIVAQEMVRLAGAVRPSRWLLYFPLYNGVDSLKIGVPSGARLGPCSGNCALGLDAKPIVWYGSSITQGACASKPGDAYTNAIARGLQRPVANFGFSGNCFYEPEVMEFILEIDAAIYIIDCNPNYEGSGFDKVHQRARDLVLQSLAARPNAIIILASATPLASRDWGNNGPMWLDPQATATHSNGTAAVRKVYDELIQKGESRLRFVDGDLIYAQPHGDAAPHWEMTVAGAHPTSLGMERFTAYWTPLLRDILAGISEVGRATDGGEAVRV